MIKSVLPRFSFNNLINRLQKKAFLSNRKKRQIAEIFAAATQDVILRGDIEPKLRPSTLEIRRNVKKNWNENPLLDTGSLLDSIKGTERGIEMLEYGRYQNEGFTLKESGFTRKHNIKSPQRVDARPFLITEAEISDDLLDELESEILHIITQK